jgi:hypothetical protein
MFSVFRNWLYQLQNALFARRRYLPAPARQFLKPIYQRRWRTEAQKKLTTALAAQAALSALSRTTCVS